MKPGQLRPGVARIALAIGAAIACGNLAAQTHLTFRGSALGDVRSQVEAAAAHEFETSQLTTPVRPDESPVLVAGDARSIADDVCPYGAPDERRRQCILVRYVFANSSLGGGLDAVFVDQAFSPGVPVRAFLDKLAAAYGPARLIYKDGRPGTPFDRTAGEIVTMVWGGAKRPSPSYRMSAFPYGDIEAIGGAFIAAEIECANGMVRGYRLRMIDSDSMQRAGAKVRGDIKANAEARQRAAEATLKF